MIADIYTIFYFLNGKRIDQGFACGTYHQVLDVAAWSTHSMHGEYFRLYHHATSTIYPPMHYSEALAFLSEMSLDAKRKPYQGGVRWTGD